MRKFALTALLLGALTASVTTPSLLLATPAAAAQTGCQTLRSPGERMPLEGGGYFTYGFDKQPKLGMCIMRVEVFGRDGTRDTTFAVRGNADMPSMRGAHSTGDRDFSLSAKGVYLLPVRLVMPGDWEVVLTLLKKGKPVFRGAYLFDL